MWGRNDYKGDKVMNIKAQVCGRDVTIIAIMEGIPNAVKVIYVDEDGEINYIYSNNHFLKITDKNYLPKETR